MVFAGPQLRAGGEVLRTLHMHGLGCQVQHHRCLHFAAVNTEAMLMRAELLVGRVVHQPEPAGAVDQQAMLDAQLARNDVHHADLAAMTVEQQQLPDAGARHAGAQLRPQRDQRGRLQAQGARIVRMLDRKADVLRRQKQHRQLGGQLRQSGIDDALYQAGIHRQRQMRPMLLHRRHGQHGHGVCGQAIVLGQGKVMGRCLGPEA